MLAILWLMAIRITVMQRLIFTTKGNTSMSIPTMCLLFSIELHVQEGEDQRERVQCREYYCRDLALVLDRFLFWTEQRTYVNRRRFRSLEPEADAQPGCGNAPDDVTSDDDDEERNKVGGHDYCETGPGVPSRVVDWWVAWFGWVVPEVKGNTIW
jgi:hypothetical protein